MEKRVEEFHRKSGEILRMALHVETTLDFFISNYFCYPQTYRTFLLNDSILIKMGFERKIKIFEEICKKEEIGPEEYRETIRAMNYVKDKRNKVAHYEAFVSNPEEGIKLQPRKSEIFGREVLKLTDELIKKIDEERLSAIQGVTKIHLKLNEKLRKKWS